MMWKSIGLTAALLGVVASVALAQGTRKAPSIVEEMKRREKEIKASEARKDWQNISWRQTPAEAVADAAKEKKPLLIVLIVGELGRAQAERC